MSLIMICTAHEDLWNGRILHRDISLHNVMLSPPKTEGEHCRGLLIDFDYAFSYPPDKTDGDASDDEVAGSDGEIAGDNGKVVSGDGEVTGGNGGAADNDKTTSQPPRGALLHCTVL